MNDSSPTSVSTAPYSSPLDTPIPNKSDSDHEHEHLDTHHELPTSSQLTRAGTASRPTVSRPQSSQSVALLRPRSSSSSIPITPNRNVLLKRNPPIPTLESLTPGQTSNPQSAPTVGAPSQSTSPPPLFPALVPSESRVSNRTFIEPAGLLTGYSVLARSDTRASRAATIQTLEKTDNAEDKDAEIGAVETADGFMEFTFPDGGSRAWICVAEGSAALFCGFVRLTISILRRLLT